MSTRRFSAFSPRSVILLVVVGGLAFLLALYALGAGLTGDNGRNGGAHAAGNGLNGYSALAELLERRGYDVALSRTKSALQNENLLIMSPPSSADSEDLSDLIAERRYIGPTILIVPKWWTFDASRIPGVEAKKGWIGLSGAMTPSWADSVMSLGELKVTLKELPESKPQWRGLSLSGTLPDTKEVQSLSGDGWPALVTDSEGRTLVGYMQDGYSYPGLAAAAGVTESDPDNVDLYPVILVAEPDLMNNYGMADVARARLAVMVTDLALEGQDLPVVFDLTFHGLGATRNLLTLAFEPPFLAATLCLIFAALLVGWRGFVRFGPPLRDEPAFAKGKEQLIRNGAALIQRTKRYRLLGAPYADIIMDRLAARLGISQRQDTERDEAVFRALSARELDAQAFEQSLKSLRQASRPHDVLRAAKALRQMERTLSR
ncbi:DUF4350 domain-containing protein [Altericroceibacterium endophyticum]|uniref:DUF4350 domain-containing protein n=1 Tax=Altericroceibacterium endophyticum TaxID=1808508 RepID=A0A6I4T572_9SPHN|nr:DUF4350 domain-containing protein [Altericroceibacterium endophyticum]MXO65060.1 DUF4350 domain-containing protein [Altericroceibacterium endophyticum]